MASVYLIEWQGCECGGLSPVAFSSRESAEMWVHENTEPFASYPALRRPKEIAVDGYEIKEVELQA